MDLTTIFYVAILVSVLVTGIAIVLNYFYRKQCNHIWELYTSGHMIDSVGDKIGKYYHLRCEKCGKMKQEKFK